MVARSLAFLLSYGSVSLLMTRLKHYAFCLEKNSVRHQTGVSISFLSHYIVNGDL